MKTLLLIVVLGAAVWFLMWKAKQNAAVQAMQQAPVTYTKSLASDAERARQATETANKVISQTSQDAQKAVDAQ